MLTSPLPKCHSQARLTRTRAVKRVLGVGDRSSHLEPAAPLLKRSTVGLGEQAQEPPRHGRARSPGIAPDEDVRLDGLRRVVDHHRTRRSTRVRRFEVDDRAVQLIELTGLLLIEKLPHRVRRYLERSAGCRRAPAGATPNRARARPAEPATSRHALSSAPRAGRKASYTARRPRPCWRADCRAPILATSGWIGGGLGVVGAGQLALNLGRPGRELVLGQGRRRHSRGRPPGREPCSLPRGDASRS